VCVGSLLSTNSREEQANAPIKSQSDHDANSASHELDALNTKPIETSGDVTKALSIDAKTFQPLPKLNVHALAYDPATL
jgi:hypothetical protein